VEAQKVLGKKVAYSSVLAKSFAASLFKLVPLKIKIDLVGAKLKAAKAVAIGKQAFTFLEGIKLDFRFLFLGIAICAAVFGYGVMRIAPEREATIGIKNKRVKIKSVVEGDVIESLSTIGANYRKKISTLDSLVSNRTYLTYSLDAIPRVLPEGVWLDNFSFSEKSGAGLELILDGNVYLGDSEKEVDSVNTFLANLKKDPGFSRYFKDINLSTIERKVEQGKSILVFTIVCRE
jgi:Fimbrial assembly protein (PilN)